MEHGFRVKIIAASTLIVLFVIGWYFIYYSPKKHKIAELKQEIKVKQREFELADVILGTLDSLKQEIAEMQALPQRSMALSVPQDSMLYVLRILEEKIKEHNLEITGRIKPNKQELFSHTPGDSLQMKTGIKTVDIELSLKGTFYDLVHFLESFSEFPFLIKAGALRMNTGDNIFPDIETRLKVYVFSSITEIPGTSTILPSGEEIQQDVPVQQPASITSQRESKFPPKLELKLKDDPFYREVKRQVFESDTTDVFNRIANLTFRGSVEYGKIKIALINDGLYEIGDIVGGFKIIEIHSDRVVLKDRDGTGYTLRWEVPRE